MWFQKPQIKARNGFVSVLLHSVHADLELHRQKLLDGERVNSELASLAQHRLKEMEKLQRFGFP